VPGVLDLFDTRRALDPTAPAVVADGTTWSYADLDARSRAHAAELTRAGAGAEDVVAVVAERGPRYVAMVLGVLRAGAAFLPVEPATPVRRARQLCVGAGVRALLVEPGHEEYAAGLPVTPPRHAARGVRHPHGLAYVIFTSGSTGTPKGAMVTDAGMANHIAAKTEDLSLTAADVVGLTAPLSFDISVWQALTPLTTGGTVAVASPADIGEPAELVAWVRRHGVTVLELVPSFLAVLLDALAADEGLRGGLSSLRYLVATGEALPGPLAARWYGTVPDVPVVNAYGPTECADDVTHHVVTAADCATPWPPIGREIRHTRVYVVGPDGRECGPGVEGELFVGGRGVGRGYVGEPVRTALAFVPDHLSGTPGARLYRTGDRGSRVGDGPIDYLGRRDRQVKIRGHRVELGDAEAQLLSLPAVTSAACVLAEGRLHAFVTLRSGTADEVLAGVRAGAPAYLVPHEVTVLERLPVTRSGKVDPRSLAGMVTRRAAQAPATSGELTLAAVRSLFAELLGPVGPDDDFFARGGDSLSAMRLVSLARKRFGAEGASLRGFLAEPTPRGLLAVLTTARAVVRAAPAPVEPGALSSGQERLWFLEQLLPGKGAQLIRLTLTLRGRLDRRALKHALSAVVRRHEPLRTVFTQRRGIPVAIVHPEAEVRLSTEDRPPLSARTTHPPLMAADLARVAEDEHRLDLVLHHLVADGWSLAVLGREIATYYQNWLDGVPDVPLPDSTFGQYVAAERAWLAGSEAVECELYWTSQLDGAPPVLDLPLDRPRPAKPDFTASRVVTYLGEAETAAVTAAARAVRATPFMAVTAAFHTVLAEVTGAGDLVVGIDSVNRSWPGSEELVGTFVNQLPVRLTAPAEPTFRRVLELVARQCLGAYEHDRLPFHKIVAAVNPPRVAARFPLFQVKVTHQSAWRTGVALRDIEVVPSDIAEPVTDLDLMLDVSGETDRLRLELLYRPEIVDEATARRWVEAVAEVLRDGAADPDARRTPSANGARR
jgi:amino acid adenylation domain-containing protein